MDMNHWVVEYYSNDESKWLECSNDFLCQLDAIKCMRLHADNDPDLAHRVVHIEIKRNSIALSACGEELIQGEQKWLDK